MELEIKDLTQSQIKLKNEIEKNKEDYEKFIDDAADQISNFVEKANLEKRS